MNSIITYLRDFNMLSIILRMILAMILAGLIGIERGRKRRPAGFRTHILVCEGAALIMITSQYMMEILDFNIDVARMGAQVISGIGFLGAGTIITIDKNQVKGLTTAAGLWVCACMGLAVGIGFYEGAIITCLLMMGVMNRLRGIDSYVHGCSKVINIYVELVDMSALTNLLEYVKNSNTIVSDLEIKKEGVEGEGEIIAMMTLYLCEGCSHKLTIKDISELDGVKFLEEIF